jgi:uncharacterized protein
MSTTFLRDVSINPTNAAILARWDELALPNAWLVAGCLFQTVWNLQSGRPPGADIKDYDLFYFDATDLSESGEQQAQARIDAVLADLEITVEIANQARVHLWYPRYFGRPYPKLSSSEEGIERFLVLETCVGVRPNECHAPFGLQGVYAGTLSPNPLTPYAELFEEKVASYRTRWPHLAATAAPDVARRLGLRAGMDEAER